MTPEKYEKLSKEEKLEYCAELLKKIKWDFDAKGRLQATNLEFYDPGDGSYHDTHLIEYYETIFYRIKPEPEYVQFTYEDRNLFMGKIVKDKSGENTYLITRANSAYVWTGNGYWDYYYGFENLVFADGSPFGKKVQS